MNIHIVTIDVASELDARGIEADLTEATQIIEDNIREYLESYLIDILENNGLTITWKD